MGLTVQGYRYTNFGPQGGGQDSFLNVDDFSIVVGRGFATETSDSLEQEMAASSSLALTRETVGYSGTNLTGELVRIIGWVSVDQPINEVGIRHSDGTFIFIEPVRRSESDFISVVTHDNESSRVEIVLLRLSHRDPITVYEDQRVKVMMPRLSNSAGYTPWAINYSMRNDIMYRDRSVDVYKHFGDAVTSVDRTVDENGTPYVTVDLKLAPSDSFHHPFHEDQLQDLWIGTDDTANLGLLQIHWKEPLIREPEQTFHIKVPLVFNLKRLS